MININSLDTVKYFSNVESRFIKTKKGIEYLNVESAFDIETTSIKSGEEKYAFMYIWMIGIGLNNPVVYGRKWEELRYFLLEASEKLELKEERRLPVYVHNLGYEFQFMRKYFNWYDVFAVGERKPIKAPMYGGIEFRDSYILSGYSLENTAKNLNTYKVKKLVGNLDYSLVRHHKTPLTDDELAYCENDILVVMAYIKEEIEQYGDIAKIPMTNTGRVRKYVRNECYQTNGNHKKKSNAKYSKYRKIMQDLTLDVETYHQLKRAFMGGFTHASNKYSGKVLEGVDSVDLTSSYPTVMISEYFPMSRGRKIDITSISQLKEMAEYYCLVFDVKFTGLKNKIGYESYISESRCVVLKSPIIDNGRVFMAEELTTTITEIDFDIIEAIYEWESVSIANVNGFLKGRLPKPIVKSILDLYVKKTELKDVEGYETEYLLAKCMLNSVYGMSVTDVLQDIHEYNNGWKQLPIDVEGAIEDYNNSKNRFLYYPWGVWVTAYARRNVWSAILNVGEEYVYCDTDSVKMLNYEKHKAFVERYNAWITKRLEKAVSEAGLDASMLAPKNVKGKAKPLGIWEHEGHYRRFKTLGAKRYMYQEGDAFALVVAGLSKQKGMEYIKRKCRGDSVAIFDMFDDSLFIPANETGKMTHTYIDDAATIDVLDYNGDMETVDVESGIHLEPCEFTLSISAQYAKFMQMLKAGYMFNGVKYQ